jgi:ubiquinone/menaquinone biosynthesis C-methylase UbiE
VRTFWDFYAPVYDFAEKVNGHAYAGMLKTVNGLVPAGASVMEVAAGTGAISIAVSGKADHVLCTDVSEPMLGVARRKISRRGIKNIELDNQSIFAIDAPDDSFDVVIAGQILHLIDEPEKAAAEIRRVAKSLAILPMSFTKDLKGFAKLGVSIYRVFGFAPAVEFIPSEYKRFLTSIGFDMCEHIQIAGRIPMAVAVWEKTP